MQILCYSLAMNPHKRYYITKVLSNSFPWPENKTNIQNYVFIFLYLQFYLCINVLPANKSSEKLNVND
jgi:hypothetical protein